MSFDVLAQVFKDQRYQWQNRYEIFSVCRRCGRPTIFVVSLSEYEAAQAFTIHHALVDYKHALNKFFIVEKYVSLRENVTRKTPEHVPEEIASTFEEGTTCLAVECHNAAACMFRLCVDLATKPLLPLATDRSRPQPNEKQRRDLGLRLHWLFDNGMLAAELKELAKCIREDANDGAHVGNLQKPDAEDLLDFTETLLNRLYTAPEKLRLAQARRDTRRAGK